MALTPWEFDLLKEIDEFFNIRYNTARKNISDVETGATEDTHAPLQVGVMEAEMSKM